MLGSVRFSCWGNKMGTYTREQFLRELKELRLTQTGLARLVGLSRITVAHWGTEHARFPGWLQPLVSAMLCCQGLRREGE